MKKRKILTYVLIILVLVAGISSVVLYKLGDRIFNEVIDNHITELEESVDQPVQTDQVEPTVPAEPSAQAPEPAPKQAANLEITKDKLEDIKESVSPKDKMEAATLVLSRLSKSDINHLTKLTTGGITPEEKAEIKAIVYSRFSQAEIEQIREMYYKYMK